MKLARDYQQTLRAQKTADTRERILVEAERLFSTELFDRVTLAAVAAAAGVTIPTLQRHFGDKTGLFAGCGERIRARVQSQRGEPPVGDLASCIAQLIAHYESEGKMMWHLLRQQADVPILHRPLAEGRAHHRAWIERVFAKTIAKKRSAKERQALVDALVAVTDLFVWKLLRLDVGRSRSETESLIVAMAAAIEGGA
jgi:AcrR family transcriptional regulator